MDFFYIIACLLTLLNCRYYEYLVSKGIQFSNSVKKLIYMFLGLPCVLVIGFRSITTGADTIRYFYGFQECIGVDFLKFTFSSFYFLHNFIFWSCANIFHSFSLLTFGYSLFTFYFLFKALDIWQHGKYISFSFFLFFLCLFVCMSDVMRQMLTVTMFMYIIALLYKGKIKNAIFISSMSIFIHPASFLFIFLIPFLYWKKLKRHTVIILEFFYLCLIIILSIPSFPYMVLSLIAKVFPTKARFAYLFLDANTGKIGLGMLLYIFPYFFPLIMLYRECEKKREVLLLANIILLVVPIRVWAYTSFFIFRLIHYSGVLITFYSYEVLCSNKRSFSKNLVRSVFLIFAMVYFIFFFYILNYDIYFPYSIGVY